MSRWSSRYLPGDRPNSVPKAGRFLNQKGAESSTRRAARMAAEAPEVFTEKPCSVCRMAEAEHPDGRCDECFLKERKPFSTVSQIL